MEIWLRYILGFVRIQVKGQATVRFLNLCHNRDIFLWEIESNNDGFSMNMFICDFKQIKDLAKKTNSGVTILKKYGLPFFWLRIKKHKIFMLGIFIALMVWSISEIFVWNIQFQGNQWVSNDSLYKFLKEQHIEVGTLKNNIELEKLEDLIRDKYPQIIWISAKLKGCNLVICMEESLPKEKPENVDLYSDDNVDFISEFDGEIVGMIVRRGVPMVKVHDVVKKDQILVSGDIPIFNEDGSIKNTLHAKADADIILKHKISYEITLPATYTEKEYTERKNNIYFIQFAEHKISLPKEVKFPYYDVTYENINRGFHFGRYECFEYIKVEHRYTRKQAEDILNEKNMVFIGTLEEKGVQIIEKDVKIEECGFEWVLKTELLVLEKMG